MSELFAIKLDKESQTYQVSGELTLDTARAVMQDTETLFSAAEPIAIDLSGVTRADSAALALVVTWMRQANQANKRIHFQHVPNQMLAIAKASGLDEILPIQD